MGELVDGVWHSGWRLRGGAKGEFERSKTTFRGHPEVIAPGRFHLYVAKACPWAHRVLITRALRGLEQVVGVTVVDPRMGEDGWVFKADDPDPIGGARFLREVYLRADPKCTGRVTVPVLWDREKDTIVNNESREVMRLLDVGFAALSRDPAIATLAPDALLPEIERVLDAIYEPINNGVYRAGFARSQEAYEDAVRELFAALDHWDDVLEGRPFTCGDVMTEADVALFTTFIRFDLVYHAHFKCNVRRLQDYQHLWRFTRRMYANDAVRGTCALDEIKTHYYWSQDNVNPSRIVPVGPSDYARALEAPL